MVWLMNAAFWGGMLIIAGTLLPLLIERQHWVRGRRRRRRSWRR